MCRAAQITARYDEEYFCNKGERVDLSNITHSADMLLAEEWLKHHSIRYTFHPPYQLKVGGINFWPNRGTITVDGEKRKREERGLQAFYDLVEEMGHRPKTSEIRDELSMTMHISLES